jgi:hypothetical protein
MTTSAVTQFGGSPAGTKACGFSPSDRVRVLVSPTDQEYNEEAFGLACRMSRADDTIAALREQIETLRSKIQIQEAKPARMFGPAWVRFDTSAVGGIWALSDRAKGWGSGGFRYASWDDLFRDLNVKVTAHGQDETGPWWQIENC